MRGFEGERDSVLHRLPRLPDITKKPIHLSKVSRRGSAGVLNGLNLEPARTLGIVQPKRLANMRSRLREITLPNARQGQNAAADGRLRRSTFLLRFATKGLGCLSRQ